MRPRTEYRGGHTINPQSVLGRRGKNEPASSLILLTQPHQSEGVQLRMARRENHPENTIRLDAMSQAGSSQVRCKGNPCLIPTPPLEQREKNRCDHQGSNPGVLLPLSTGEEGRTCSFQEEEAARKGVTRAVPFLNPAHHVGHPLSLMENQEPARTSFNICEWVESLQHVSMDWAGNAGKAEMALLALTVSRGFLKSGSLLKLSLCI